MSSSTVKNLTFEMRPPPPKAHLHKTLPDSAFPKGFLLSGTHVGIKKSKSAEDLGLILTTSPAERTSAAAVFTQNSFAAAPVRVSANVLAARSGRGVRGVVVNSGCANAVTGQKGEEDAWAMVRAAGEVGNAAVASTTSSSPAGDNDEANMLVMSTGVIGVRLPIDKILSGIQALPSSLGSSPAHWDSVARAFLTTDTFPKLRARTFAVTHADGTQREYRLAGMSKGAGMIHPRMGASVPTATGLHATLLSAIMTDVHVAPKALQSALNYACARSFNAISVDGDMSTNDTVVVLASGAADALEIDEKDNESFIQFRDALTDVAKELAQLVVRDGEGATKFVTVTVKGTKTYDDAHTIASRISTSALVKTALYGEDANWGRILASLGSLQELSAPIDPSRVSVSFIPAQQQNGTAPSDSPKPLLLLHNGEPQPLDEAHASSLLSQTDIEILLDIGLGEESAQYWTCDFSYEYVRINGDYRS
ncbi:arginine biosynthesis bifunctional protein ARG7 [Schizopora paradoxa]|uniref:Arginine biosynthesis bifunctional protein ArgJ, mitochondrial n=1 Tax=Schizopora paradoxa TaxID=27342 RepID=A0A0H2SBM1_9AGAM|nr:arginine biosynthesis bifunctional protein ARG7 [Schizopora paradoxa]